MSKNLAEKINGNSGEADHSGDNGGSPRPARFQLGRTLATPGALDALAEAGQTGAEFMRRHVTGDWGVVGDEDAAENELSVREGFRILSAYLTTKGVKVWVITEADRSATTILLPSEY